MIIRLAKIAMIAALAAFAFIVTWDNIVDYGTNYEFVKHVLSMDTTSPGNKLMRRAITNETVWVWGYACIIAAEGLTCLLLSIGALALLIPAAARAGRALQPRQALDGRWRDGRLRRLVLRLHGGCR